MIKRWDDGNQSLRPSWGSGSERDYGTETESWIYWQDDCVRDSYSLNQSGSKIRRVPSVKIFSNICRDGCFCKGENYHEY